MPSCAATGLMYPSVCRGIMMPFGAPARRFADRANCGMLILHRSLHILVSHRSHDGSQVSGSVQNPGAVIMSATIQDKIFGKPSFDPSFAKSLRHCGEMSRLGAFRRENPSFAFFSAPLFKNV